MSPEARPHIAEERVQGGVGKPQRCPLGMRIEELPAIETIPITEIQQY